jgi:hypothetical protein
MKIKGNKMNIIENNYPHYCMNNSLLRNLETR